MKTSTTINACTDPETPVFLAATAIINYHEPGVRQQVAKLAQGLTLDVDIAKACFEFVRDHIQHSVDYQRNPVTCHASEVLQYKTGFCFAKSHLLTALLRANQIPAGFCYQRLILDSRALARHITPTYSLHGVNAVYLNNYGWYRCDPRGNRAQGEFPGEGTAIQAEFNPPFEQLAYTIEHMGEQDLPEIHAEPLPAVVRVLTQYNDYQTAADHLPDLEPAPDN